MYPQAMSPPPPAGTVPVYNNMVPVPGHSPVPGYPPQYVPPNYATPPPGVPPMGGMPPPTSPHPPYMNQPPRHSPAPPVAQQQVQKGTLRPGQEIKVGKQVVVIEKYLSEGGYAHVYLTRSQQPIGRNGLTTHCLKRIAFRDDQGNDMFKETEKEIHVMKALRGNDRIVEYLDSEMRRLESRRDGGPGWEVFILMEFCAGEFSILQ